MNAAFTNTFDSDFDSTDFSKNANPNFALPRQITNQVTGDVMTVIHSATDAHDSLKIEFTLPPHSKGSPLHYHLNFVETFEVSDGKLQMCVGGAISKRIVEPGELITVPKGTLHNFSNPHDESATFVTEIVPAADFEKFIRSMFGLANDGKTTNEGMPKNPLHFALILEYADLYFPYLPSGLQRFVKQTLATIARRMGAEKDLSVYFAAPTN